LIVRGATLPTLERLIFQAPPGTTLTTALEDGTLNLNFASRLTVEPAALKRALPDGVALLSHETGKAKTRLEPFDAEGLAGQELPGRGRTDGRSPAPHQNHRTLTLAEPANMRPEARADARPSTGCCRASPPTPEPARDQLLRLRPATVIDRDDPRR
jgi:hypothetical protein